jgi:hypothetical protein
MLSVLIFYAYSLLFGSEDKLASDPREKVAFFIGNNACIEPVTREKRSVLFRCVIGKSETELRSYVFASAALIPRSLS